MTPEETIIFSFVAGGIGAFLGAYLRQKGKDFAIKESIAKITRIQEEIRAELANHSHFSRARYDREMEIYQKVWPKLMNFYEVMVLGSNADPNSGLAYHKATNEVIDAVRENRPFFPKEIRQEVLAFQGLCENQRFSEFVIRVRELSSDEKKAFFESQEKMKT